MIFDTHVHLNDEKYLNDLEEVLDNAVNNNVMYMNVIAWDKKSSYSAIEIVKKYNNYKGLKLVCSVGVHPENLKEMDDSDKDLNWLIDLLKNDENKDIITSVGEIGLDLYWDKSYTDLQIEYFKKQIKIANDFNLPIVVHSREAIQLTFDIIKEAKAMYPNLRGVIHSYSGSLEMAKEFIKKGFYIGVGGVLTYKNSNLPSVINEVDAKYIISETDAPYLPPVPYRGKRNEPSYIVHTVEKLSSIKEDKNKVIEEQIFNNALSLFIK